VIGFLHNKTNMSSPYLLLPNLYNIEPVVGRATKVLHQDNKSKVVLLEFLPGQGLPPHAAAFPGFIMILTGEANLQLGDDTHQASSGFFAHMAPGLKHAILAVTGLRMLLILQLS